jgi:transcription elongation GreA/GreB family factor
MGGFLDRSEKLLSSRKERKPLPEEDESVDGVDLDATIVVEGDDDNMQSVMFDFGHDDTDDDE